MYSTTHKYRLLFIPILTFLLAMMPLKVNYDYQTLGSWDANGVPSYLDGRISVPTDIVDRTRQLIEDSLRISGNEFLDRNATDVYLRTEGEVFVTLLYEDAGWKNTLGFYTYTVDDIPENQNEIGDLTIIFPNIDSPDIVDNGMRISLGTFPKHTVFGFFLVAQGWNGGITDGDYMLFTNGDFNASFTAGTLYNQMTIIFSNDLTNSKDFDFLLCMEDNVDLSAGDYDYNDAVFQLESSPETSLDQFRPEALIAPTVEDTLITVFQHDTVTFSIDSLLQDHNYIDYSSLEILTPVDGDNISEISFNGTDLTVGMTDGVFDTLALDYRICNEDFTTLCDTGVIYITLGHINQPPVALKDSVITYDVSLTSTGLPLSVLGSDPDSNLNMNHLKVITSPNDVFFTIADNGHIKIVPQLNASGIDTAFFEICDLGMPVYCDTGYFLVNFPVLPTALDDVVNLPDGHEISIDVLANDTHPEDDLDPSTLKIIDEPDIEGVEFEVVDGEIVHTPPEDFVGSYDVTYEICDTSNPPDCDQAVLTITVFDDDPVAVNDTLRLPDGSPVNIDVLANDSHPQDDLNPSSLKIIEEPDITGATFEVVNGEIVHTPPEGFVGTYELTYEICDNSTPADCDQAVVFITVFDDDPVAVNDTLSLPSGELASIDVLGNDTHPEDDFDPSTLKIIEEPDIEGVEFEVIDGEIVHTPPEGFEGTYELTYEICDNSTPADCEQAVVVITVSDDNPNVRTNLPPVAKDDFAVTDVNVSVTLPILENDYDPDGGLDYFTVTQITEPLNGSVLFDGSISDGDTIVTAHYFPNQGYTGVDIFTYEVYDNGNPRRKDEAIGIILIGDEGFVAGNSPLYWIDSVKIFEGESYNHPLQEKVEQVTEIDLSSPTTTLFGSPDLEGASASAVDSLNILYTAPDSVISDGERDYVYYRVCNSADECGYGLLIVDIYPEGTEIVEEIDIMVYNGFSPNNDLVNDVFVVENIERYKDNQLKIYNRWGQEIYYKEGYANEWTGNNNNGEPLPDGTYFYVILIELNNKTNTFNGYVVLKR
ncbi:Ig-like domain-containing protein [Flammeovirga aprica]|uniref:Tandem-95 repeat protein n=1 Tax=Flammeovirga aprica JL-4 TaxID=694437 RepID=A0A7X9RUB0_9BACT|nr:Ig-like domain-containing protein [Flammeovirga aprica]NME68835.1 tandem-95 repeat protein [Flammeovirga aprica JL-4]